MEGRGPRHNDPKLINLQGFLYSTWQDAVGAGTIPVLMEKGGCDYGTMYYVQYLSMNDTREILFYFLLELPLL
jgi:hypothetical protein